MTTTYGYDTAHRATSAVWSDAAYQWAPGSAATTAYSPDKLASASDSGGALLATYAYNPLSHGTGVTLAGSAGSETAVFSKAGDLTGLTQAWASGGGVTTTYGYDTVRRATSASWSDAAYQWTPGSAATTAYSPDKLNRYAAVAGTSFSYDGRPLLPATSPPCAWLGARSATAPQRHHPPLTTLSRSRARTEALSLSNYCANGAKLEWLGEAATYHPRVHRRSVGARGRNGPGEGE